MRCRNCGWPNKPSEKFCTKCHAPLEEDRDNSYNAEVASSNNSSYDNRSPLNKTVMETDVFGPGSSSRGYSEPEESTGGAEMNQCPKCGYPIRPGTDKCPHCKFSIGQTMPEPDYNARPESKENTRENRPYRPTSLTGQDAKSGPSPKYRGTTVNPYMMNLELEPTFILKPLKKFNERHELEEREYEGDSVVLNRSNTEEKNASITSREQAVVTNVGGKWFIEDKSEQKTTFVQASHQVELHDGDIILLGNRLFEFHA